MFRGNPPPPPHIPFFFFFLSLFLHFSKKNLKISGGGLNPLNPPPLNTPLVPALVVSIKQRDKHETIADVSMDTQAGAFFRGFSTEDNLLRWLIIAIISNSLVDNF